MPDFAPKTVDSVLRADSDGGHGVIVEFHVLAVHTCGKRAKSIPVRASQHHSSTRRRRISSAVSGRFPKKSQWVRPAR